MNEASLKGELVKLARADMKSWVILRHEDHFTHGIPDITFTGEKQTSWIEVKFANPKYSVKGIQELTMKRLALAGLAVFVVYYLMKTGEKRTYILNPWEIQDSLDEMPPEKYADGFNHQYVVDHVRRVHGQNG